MHMIDSSGEAGLKEDLVDVSYNGLGLLPKRLRWNLVNPLNWQTVLRCTLLRLPPSKFLREAVGMLDSAGVRETIQGISSPVSSSKRASASSSSLAAPNVGRKGKANLDVLNKVSSDVHAVFNTLQDAAVQLQTKEFHQLDVREKVTLTVIIILTLPLPLTLTLTLS